MMQRAILIFGFFIFSLSGCVIAPTTIPPKPTAPAFYHRMEKGQTLWGISRMYNIGLDELLKANHISDATNIEIGQLILIPQAQKPQALAAKSDIENFIWPLKGKMLAAFGQVFNNTVNKGINIQPYGDRNILASRSGKAVFCADNLSGFGKTIIIDHGDGFLTVYARNSEILIKAGDMVEKGTPIAKAGATGGRDKNVYLHFEIRKGNVPQNPNFYLAYSN